MCEGGSYPLDCEMNFEIYPEDGLTADVFYAENGLCQSTNEPLSDYWHVRTCEDLGNTMNSLSEQLGYN